MASKKQPCIDCGKLCRGKRCRSCFLIYMKSEEYRQKMSVAALAAHENATWKTKEWREKQSEIQKSIQKKPETRKRKSKSAKLAHKYGNYGKEWRQKISKTHRKPEVKQKISRAVRAAHARGCYKDAHHRQAKRLKAAWERGEIGTEEWCRKNKEAQDRPEVRAKKSKALKGEKNPNWQGGVSFEPYSPDWNEIRTSILERDDYKCVICDLSGDKRNCPIHHIDYNKKNNDPSNLVTLCESHHAQTTAGDRDFWQVYLGDRVYLVLGVC